MKTIFQITWLSVVSFLIFMCCSTPLSSHFIQAQDIEQLPNSYEGINTDPNNRKRIDPLAYAPDTNHLDHTPMKYVRMNFHFMNSTDSKNNLTGDAARKFAKDMINTANRNMAKNRKMLLPTGNNTPVLPLQFKFVLSPNPNIPGNDGIYFHQDDDLYYYIHRGRNRNRHKREVIKKYGVQLDTVLNVFIMPHHPDSLASPTYKAYDVGIALRNALKINGNIKTKKGSFFATILSHEVGHILGLSHAWLKHDGCDDTPTHKNDCLNRSAPGCEGRTSNNVMDYNIYQKAWTPCQIGKIHAKFARETSIQRKFIEPLWCESKESKHIRITDTIFWDIEKDLEGPLTIEAGGSLRISKRLSMPEGSKITIKAGGTLILDHVKLHNTCGNTWEGIEIQELGKQKGKLQEIGDCKVENTIHPYPNF